MRDSVMTQTAKRLHTMLGVGTAALLCAALTAQAQIGSNWNEYFPSKGYSGFSQSTRYSISGNVEHFWIYNTDPIEPSGSGPRSEWHVENSYTTTHEQFQGDLNAENGTTGYTCMQIFGG